jgi:tetratricopeptide (TPR) repeat protein
VVLTEGIDRAAREWMRAHTPDSSPSPDELMRLQTQHQALNRAALADPVDTDVLLELGIVCLALGKLDEAEHAFKGVLDHVDSYSGFEEVDSRSRQAARQHEPFDLPSAIRLPLCYLGFVYEGLGEHRLGERHVLAASFDCQDPSVLVLAGRFYLESSSPEPDTAIAYLKQAIELEPRYVATCDEMLDGFVETHRALYPVASWRLVESALKIWGTARDQALAGSSARPIDP